MNSDVQTRLHVTVASDADRDVIAITDRDQDFVQYVLDEVHQRQEAEDAFYASIDERTGEIHDRPESPQGG